MNVNVSEKRQKDENKKNKMNLTEEIIDIPEIHKNPLLNYY